MSHSYYRGEGEIIADGCEVWWQAARVDHILSVGIAFLNLRVESKKQASSLKEMDRQVDWCRGPSR